MHPKREGVPADYRDIEGKPDRPRILHILASLNRGGIETWLMHMLRNEDSFSVQHELLLTRQASGEYEEEARRLGVKIHKLPIGNNKGVWLRSLRDFLQSNGPFAAVHSHVYLFSAPVLSAAKRAGIAVRIAHCHTARSRGGDHQTLWHKLRRQVAILWLNRVATRRIGISDAAIEEIAGRSWRGNATNSVLFYGFDFSTFEGAAERASDVRKTLALGEAPVVGHVGRFEPVKNHAFLLESFAAALGEIPEAKLVLVGDGPLYEEIKAKAEVLGIDAKTRFPGTTDDVASYMHMFDLFVLPSLSEGLGIVVVEAQAAGTPSIASDAVPTEAAVIPGAVEFMPLSAGAQSWGRAIANKLRVSRSQRNQWLEQVEDGRFGICRCIGELDEIYRFELGLDH